MTSATPARRREGGSVSVTAIGFLVVITMLVVVVVNASAAYLQRQELNNLADGAALAAADGLDETGFYTERTVTLDAREARALVGQHLAGRDVRSVDVSVRGDSVTVRLDRSVSLALAPPGWTSRTTVVAEATSQLRQND